MKKLISSADLAKVEDAQVENNSPKPEEPKWYDKFSKFVTIEDLVSIILTIVISLVTFWAFRDWVLEGMKNYFLRSLLALGLSALSLLGISTAMKTKSTIASAIVVGLLFWFSLGLVRHYLVEPKVFDSMETVVPSDEARTLQVGEHAFPLKEGEETPWLRFPEGGIYNYNVSSPGDRWEIQYDDEVIPLKGWELKAFPYKKAISFKLISKQNQTVIVKVVKQS